MRNNHGYPYSTARRLLHGASVRCSWCRASTIVCRSDRALRIDTYACLRVSSGGRSMKTGLPGQRRFYTAAFCSVAILMSWIAAACITACALDLLPDALAADAMACAVLAIFACLIVCRLHLLPVCEVESLSPEAFIREARLKCEQPAPQRVADPHVKLLLQRPIINHAHRDGRFFLCPLPLAAGPEFPRYQSRESQTGVARSGRGN